MKCSDCLYYYSEYMFNRCELTGAECFCKSQDCDLVNDDGTVNEEVLNERG